MDSLDENLKVGAPQVYSGSVGRSPFPLGLIALLLVSLLVLSFVRDGRLPPPSALVSELADEPVQLPTTRPPFDVTIEKMTYRIVPMASYELKGMVVSYHDSKTWWDYIHKAAGDFLNVNDLCVVWGADAVTGLYKEMSFSNGEFTCNYQWNTAHAAATFPKRWLVKQSHAHR